jgi:hypothetical protein
MPAPLPVVVAVAAAITAAWLSPCARAQSMHSVAALQQGADIFAAQHSASNGGNMGFLEYDVPGFGSARGSAGIFRTVWDSNDQQFYSWGISVAHNFRQGSLVAENHVFGTGTNYLTDRGQELAIAEWYTHPLYVNLGGDSLDIAVFRLDGAVMTAPNLEIAPVVLGETLIYAGHSGRPATPGTGYLPGDGFGRAFHVRADGIGLGDTSGLYIGGFFRPPSSPFFDPRGGGGTAGNSGSFGFNASGNLVSLLALQAGAPQFSMASYGLDFSNPDVLNFINATIPPVLAPNCPGDTNGDNIVNFTDLNAVLADFGESGMALPGDTNGDGVVNFTDLNEVLAAFGTSCN